MNLESFKNKILGLQVWLDNWLEKAGNDLKSSQLHAPIEEIAEVISITLEELNVSVEELHQRQVELEITHQAVIDEQKRYQELFDFAPDGYLITDYSGIIQQANISAGKLLNRPSKRLIGKPLVLFISTGDHSAYYSLLNRLQQEKKIQQVELNLLPHKLPTFPIAISVSVKNRLNKCLWLLRDLTRLKLAQAQNQESELKIREQAALIDLSTDGIFVQDLEKRIIFWNKGAEVLYGWKAEEIMQQETQQLFSEESSSQMEAALKVTLEQGNWHGEFPQITKKGRKIIVASRWTLIFDREQKPKSILVFNTDITEQKKWEKRLCHAQRLESLGTLAGGIAHDLNNILTPILGLSQLLPLENPDLNKSSLKLLKIIRSNALRAAQIVKQMLLFAQGSENEIQWKFLSIDRLIEEILGLIRETFPKSIVIEMDIAPDLWQVQGDSTQLHQVLMNLCVNARDAMPEGGKLVISAENLGVDEQYSSMNLNVKVGNYVVITVTDTGMGIPQNIIDRIFEPFFTTKEASQGTGLGLSTSYGIVQNHHGTIEVTSELGNGTKFKVYLPGSKEMAVTETIIDETTILGHKELILVVDDEPTIQEVTKISLETYNYRVLTASNGIDAIAIYVQHPQEIALVLMDLRMPEMDGLTAMNILKTINPLVNLIATSGMITKKQISAAKKIGINAFLTKPYTTEQLLLRLHTTLDCN